MFSVLCICVCTGGHSQTQEIHQGSSQTQLSIEKGAWPESHDP